MRDLNALSILPTLLVVRKRMPYSVVRTRKILIEPGRANLRCSTQQS